MMSLQVDKTGRNREIQILARRFDLSVYIVFTRGVCTKCVKGGEEAGRGRRGMGTSSGAGEQ